MRTLLEHIEAYLGEPTTRFCERGDSNHDSPQILMFSGKPFVDANTLLSFGLSRHLLIQPMSLPVRQELVMGCALEISPESLAQAMLAIAGRIIRSHKALLRGDVIFFEEQIIPNYPQTALLCTNPWYWADGFEHTIIASEQVIFVWLILIYMEEGRLIQSKGVKFWEEMLERDDADLFDLNRLPMC